MIYWLRILVGLCTHDHFTRPMRKRQRCLDCGASRWYDYGQQPGKWEKDDEVKQVEQQQAFVFEREGR